MTIHEYSPRNDDFSHDDFFPNELNITQSSLPPRPFSDLRGEHGILQYYIIFLPRDSCAAAASRLVGRVMTRAAAAY